MRLTLLLPAICLFVGCAGVDVYPVQNAHGSQGKVLGTDDSGVRFYRPAPHVWITKAVPSEKVNIETTKISEKDESSSKDKTVLRSIAGVGYSAQLVMLPDYSQEYVVCWSTGIGSVEPNFTLTDGWNLTAFASKADSKTAENITAFSSLISSVGALAGGGALVGSGSFKGAGLYKLKFEAGKFKLGELVLALE